MFKMVLQMERLEGAKRLERGKLELEELASDVESTSEMEFRETN
jgi:hypothetical protein